MSLKKEQNCSKEKKNTKKIETVWDETELTPEEEKLMGGEIRIVDLGTPYAPER